MKNKIAFDVDRTLITIEDTPNYNNIWLLHWFFRSEWDVYIWSGGGIDYAQRWAEKLGLNTMTRVIEKGSMPMDIVVDDEIDPKDCEKIKAKVVIKV
jgi:phosphoserine phosphatase